MRAPRVVVVRRLQWPFDGSRDPLVAIAAPAPGCRGRQERVDPFPCYLHDAALVREQLASVAARFPLGAPCLVSLVAFESLDRTNGCCEIASAWGEGGKETGWAASIRLWGKRIPPHPAMTRYLVAHEYGHAVEAAIARTEFSDGKAGDRSSRLGAAYRELRGLRRAPRGGYGGQTWHVATGEIFANDFRILVCDVEPEFWPHAGIRRPHEVRGLREWWVRHVADQRGRVAA